MNFTHKLLSSFSAAVMLAFSAGASAAPIPFTITAASFTPDSGYGVDASESPTGNLLDVRFSTAGFVTQNFALNAGGSFSFTFGSINFNEPSSGGGIDAGETDNLGISALLTFTAPTGMMQTITATGVATVGSVTDTQVDYVIDWSPIDALFGSGGSFRIELTDISFSDRGTLNQGATITLLTVPEADTPVNEVPANEIPEPTSIILLGLGISCVTLARRRCVVTKVAA